MVVREYQPADCKEIIRLFYGTVHSISAKDDTEEQLAVWATGKEEQREWNRSPLGHYSLAAAENGIIIGFGDSDQSGYQVIKEQRVERQGIVLIIMLWRNTGKIMDYKTWQAYIPYFYADRTFMVIIKVFLLPE